MNKGPANLGEGMARGGKGLVMVSDSKNEQDFNFIMFKISKRKGRD